MPSRSLSEIEIVTLFRSRMRIMAPGVCLVAVPNAAKRSQWAAQRAKREGMATGFPDLMALAPGKVAFLEFKTAKGKLSEAQGEWLDRLHGMGFPCGVFRDAGSAVEFLRAEGFPFIGRIAA
jgi:hypothetical protein